MERRKAILALLSEQGAVRVNELGHLLGVSQMTIHRDLRRLAAEGRLRKVHGGAVLPDSPSVDITTCPICHRSHSSRTPMVLHMADSTHRHACCPHCGLMALIETQTSVSSALVADFLYGRMVNCRAASYVIGPRIRFCCSPSILAFERREDARRFQQGFGGQLMDLDGALDALKSEMNLVAR
jgi:hypothetical protein